MRDENIISHYFFLAGGSAIRNGFNVSVPTIALYHNNTYFSREKK